MHVGIHGNPCVRECQIPTRVWAYWTVYALGGPLPSTLGHGGCLSAPSSPRGHQKDLRSARPPRSGLCCLGFRASITRRPRARGSTKWRPGRGGAGRPPPRAGARRSARPRVPPDARRDTKGWSESTERGRAYGAARGPEQPGPDYRGRSWARRNRPLERGLGCGAARLPRPSPSVNGRNGLAGRAHRGAGAALAAAAGRPGASILPRAP